MSDYYITTKSDNKVIPVDGEQIEIDGFWREAFFVHRELVAWKPDGKGITEGWRFSENWTVSESDTGRSITTGETKEDAISKAELKLKREGLVRFGEAVNASVRAGIITPRYVPPKPGELFRGAGE